LLVVSELSYFKTASYYVGVLVHNRMQARRTTKATKGLMISLCWADNPVNIEPMKNNRFLNAEDAKDAGATLAWYMRPLVPEWSGTHEGIEKMMLWVKKSYGSLISAIVPGGLRWSEGIENGMTEVRNVSIPSIPQGSGKKGLSYALAQDILELAHQHFPSIPVYFKSSCAITHMLRIPSISSVQRFARQECVMSTCPTVQRQICAQGRIHKMTLEEAQEVTNRLGIPAKVIGWSGSGVPITEPNLDTFTYALRQVMINNLGREI
jgi:hypothetical protein